VVELLFVWRDVEDECLESELDVARKLERDGRVAPDEVGQKVL
jgi:hypothetical protein